MKTFALALASTLALSAGCATTGQGLPGRDGKSPANGELDLDGVAPDDASRRFPERLKDLCERALQIFDIAPHEQKLSLNLLDRVVIRHHLADTLDLPDHPRWIHPLGALVLPFAADADAAGEQAELHVLAEGGLADLVAVIGEGTQDLRRRQPLRVLPLEGVEDVVGNP